MPDVPPSHAGVPGAVLDPSSVTVEEVAFEGAGHAFFADYRPSYSPVAAAELWERIVPFLHEHLGKE